MKIYSTVKTEAKAKEIILDEINAMMDHQESDGFWEDISLQCECGETQGLQWYEGANDLSLRVAICDCCGDDDADVNDVLEID